MDIDGALSALRAAFDADPADSLKRARAIKEMQVTDGDKVPHAPEVLGINASH